ncbi:MAG: hypothetical protein WC506_04050 [Candidatus Micrarchaeia archaeon]
MLQINETNNIPRKSGSLPASIQKKVILLEGIRKDMQGRLSILHFTTPEAVLKLEAAIGKKLDKLNYRSETAVFTIEFGGVEYADTLRRLLGRIGTSVTCMHSLPAKAKVARNYLIYVRDGLTEKDAVIKALSNDIPKGWRHAFELRIKRLLDEQAEQDSPSAITSPRAE